MVLLSACGHKKVQVQAPQASPQAAGISSSIPSSELEGLASYYAEPYHGRKTASGEVFDTYQALTAAHRTLPFNTMVRVTNKTNGREVDVRINDRGPFIDGRVVDLSLRAAREIDMERAGIAPVKLTILNLVEAAPQAPYVVQVAAFENQTTAEKVRDRLIKNYSGVTIQTAKLEEKTFYRVRIGSPDLEAANKIASRLRKEDFSPVVLRTN
jgi:rare lipoprotein A